MKFKNIVLLLTNQCPNGCSFCYRRNLIGNVGNKDMSGNTAIGIVDFLFRNDIADDESNIIFWGGEPTTKIDTILSLTKEYPQIPYSITTNSHYTKSLEEIPRLSLVWSVGDSVEKFGSIDNKILANRDMVSFVKRNKHAISFLPEDYKEFYKDYCKLRDITDKIIVELPMKYNSINSYDSKLLVDQLYNIMCKFDGDVLLSGKRATDYIDRINHGKTFKYCGCGVDRIMFDCDGTAWRCDGSYINQVDNIGSISEGIDWNKINKFVEFIKDPKSIYNNCIGCEIYGYCLRTKCMGDNLEVTGDIYKPDESFCIGNKIFYKSVNKYLEGKNNAKK